VAVAVLDGWMSRGAKNVIVLAERSSTCPAITLHKESDSLCPANRQPPATSPQPPPMVKAEYRGAGRSVVGGVGTAAEAVAAEA